MIKLFKQLFCKHSSFHCKSISEWKYKMVCNVCGKTLGVREYPNGATK